jgi:hypothetical protein
MKGATLFHRSIMSRRRTPTKPSIKIFWAEFSGSAAGGQADKYAASLPCQFSMD